MRKRVFGICRQPRPRSAFASTLSDLGDAQSDQGLRCPQSESLATIGCIEYAQNVQDDVNPYIFRILEDTIPPDEGQMMNHN